MVAIVEQRGSVAELHALDPFADGPLEEPVVWWCRPDDDAIVLGSRQSPDLLDLDACERAGLSIARRRSGGGAVVVRRAAMIWVDAVVPLGVAPDDVRGSMVWIGEHWRRALQPMTEAVLRVHGGGMVDNEWSNLVCFAGVGPGEVLVGDAKLVGLSQRRTRHGLRLQALIHRAPALHEYRRLLRPPVPDGDPVGEAWNDEIDPRSVVVALAEVMHGRITPV